VKRYLSEDISIEFMGLWDASCPRTHPHPCTNQIPGVKTVRHALALDGTTVPHFYEGHPETDVQEVWFAGNHIDICGGISKDAGLGTIALRWMIRQCFLSKSEIQFDTERLPQIHMDKTILWPTVLPYHLPESDRFEEFDSAWAKEQRACLKPMKQASPMKRNPTIMPFISFIRSRLRKPQEIPALKTGRLQVHYTVRMREEHLPEYEAILRFPGVAEIALTEGSVGVQWVYWDNDESDTHDDSLLEKKAGSLGLSRRSMATSGLVD